MNKQEFGLFASALRTYYPRENLLPNSEAMELWYRMLKDIPFKTAEISLEKWVTANKWSPSIADIRSDCCNILYGQIPEWSEAWEATRKAISRYGYNNRKEGLASLPPLASKTAEQLGWRNLCQSENQTADRANFRQIYEDLAGKEHNIRVMPHALKEEINQCMNPPATAVALP